MRYVYLQVRKIRWQFKAGVSFVAINELPKRGERKRSLLVTFEQLGIEPGGLDRKAVRVYLLNRFYQEHKR